MHTDQNRDRSDMEGELQGMELQEMNIGTPSIEKGLSPFGSSLPSLELIQKALINSKIIIVLALLGSIIFFIMLPHSRTANRFSAHIGDLSKRPKNLRRLLYLATENARRTNSLQSLSISSPKYVLDEGIEFILSYSLKSGNFDAKEKVKTISSTSESSSSSKPDPFDKRTLDPNLVVATIAPSYTLVLNKFNTVKDHALLVTDKFEPQNSALTSQDLEAWYWTIDTTNSIGFYNSNYIAGASQRHKHLQIIPLDVMFSLRPSDALTPLPIDDIISDIMDTNPSMWKQFRSNEIYSIPSFASFKHGLALLQSPDQRPRNEFYGDYLYNVYLSLLAANEIEKGPCLSSSKSQSIDVTKAKSLGLDMERDAFCKGYNLIMSSQWMMIIPRSKRDYNGQVGVNGFGFVGLLLARDEQIAKNVQMMGPMQILNDVTFSA